MRQTNPISRLRIADFRLRIGDAGRRVNAPNEPNFGRRPKKSGGDAQPVRLSLRACPERSRTGQALRRGEFCKTNPIGSAEQRSQVLCGTAVTENVTGDSPEKTNPIWATGGRCRAGLARSGTACRGNPRSGRGQALRRAKACETNPISRLRIADCRLRVERGREGVRAKRTQFRPPGGRWRRKPCETKPNLGGLGYVGKDHRVGCGSAGGYVHKTNPISGTGGRCRAGTASRTTCLL
jgi:hypothetical protein